MHSNTSPLFKKKKKEKRKKKKEKKEGSNIIKLYNCDHIN
jgi:hypothetical protein